jgi:predicted house-cleaning noncanonical NTP pyrophosphatase (MazG superfamily)
MEKVKYYTSIDDLPCLKYHQITENASLDNLIIEGNPTEEDLFNAWEKITDQVIDHNLKSPEYIESLKSNQRYVLKQLNAASGNDLAAKLIAEQEKKLHDKKDESAPDFFEIISIMSEQLYPCNPNELSTRMYLTNLNRLTKKNKPKQKG